MTSAEETCTECHLRDTNLGRVCAMSVDTGLLQLSVCTSCT